MKIIRYGLLSIAIIYLSLAFMIGRAHFHQVIFLNEACIQPDEGYNYLTCDYLRVSVDGKSFVIPKHFKTDLASIPRFLWPVFAPQYSGFVSPAILHDYFYRCRSNVTRRFADEVLYSALISENVSAFTAYKFFLAVRLFGGGEFIQQGGEC